MGKVNVWSILSHAGSLMFSDFNQFSMIWKEYSVTSCNLVCLFQTISFKSILSISTGLIMYSYQVDVLLECGCVNSLFFVVDAITTTKVLLLYCLAFIKILKVQAHLIWVFKIGRKNITQYTSRYFFFKLKYSRSTDFLNCWAFVIKKLDWSYWPKMRTESRQNCNTVTICLLSIYLI